MIGFKLVGAVMALVVAPTLFAAQEPSAVHEPRFMPANPREDASLPPLHLERAPTNGYIGGTGGTSSPATVPSTVPGVPPARRVPPPPTGDVPPPIAMEEETSAPAVGTTTPATIPASTPTDGPIVSVDSGARTTDTTSAPPSPIETETGPVTIFGPKNLLAQRYRSKFPPVVHVKNPDGSGDGAWTAYAEGNAIKMIKGLHGKPFITITVDQAAIDKAAQLGASMTPENKVELVKLFSTSSEKPFGPAPEGTFLKQTPLLPIEKKLMQIGRTSARIRYLFHKADGATNQAVKLFWGLQIKVLTIYSNKFTECLLNEIWDEIDGELDRGQAAIVPGRKFDLFCNVVGIHLMFHDDDLTSYGPLAGMIEKRLKAEMGSLDQYPPPQAERRKAAIEKRLAILAALQELIANG